MAYGMYLSAEGAQAQAKRLEVISNNLANVNTVGFKPDVATFQARFAEAIQQQDSRAGDRSVNDVGGGVKVIETLTSFAPGRLERSGRPTDMAVIGGGFFTVEGQDGEPLLTRAGNFRIDTEGRLVTANGSRPVLDTAGAPIQINPGAEWELTPDGQVSQAGARTPIGLVEPESLDELTKVGANLFRPRGEVTPVDANAREVRQGFLELSGANPTSQMMAMIETTRAFEANSRMIQSQDSMTGSLVSRLLRTA